MKATQELEHTIRESKEPSALKGKDFSMPELSSYLTGLLQEHHLSVQDIVVRCNLDRSYAYQLFNGTRKPTRNFILRFVLLLELDESEAQRLLKIAGRQSLYARNRRDAAVLYGLTHGLTPEETELLLSDLHEEGLA